MFKFKTENKSEQVLQEQIIELQTKLSFQEDLLQELNAHIITQQTQIDKLSNLCDLLKDQHKDIVASLSDSASVDEKPPHY
jgi:SlyX protein